MTRTCAQCGAALPDDTTCQALFDRCLAREFEDPAYGAVHHLTVPAYLLQHNGYSRSGWLEARRLLDGFVQGGLTPSEARRQSARAVARRKQSASSANGGRAQGSRSSPKLDRADRVQWTANIGDVRLEHADVYCDDVRRWAARVVADASALVRRLGAGETPRRWMRAPATELSASAG
ncbi:MAG: hypothetical protein IT305_29155 [Chloroflexi bacterium]|nr:hypothetical protein [Chloroflexota bacterium]